MENTRLSNAILKCTKITNCEVIKGKASVISILADLPVFNVFILKNVFR